MRRIRYAVAMSLDGYISGPNGEHDWIGLEQADAADYFRRFYAQFDTARATQQSTEVWRLGTAMALHQGATSLSISSYRGERRYVSVVPPTIGAERRPQRAPACAEAPRRSAKGLRA
jgi:hypothetical protein